MAGNRRREEAFQIPLLMWLAMLEDDPPQAGRGRKSDDLAEIRDYVLSLFQFSHEQRTKTRARRSGSQYNLLDNEVDYAFDQLEGNKEATRTRGYWEITELGLSRLKRELCCLLEREASDEDWGVLLKSTGRGDCEQLLSVLQVLDESDLAVAVRESRSVRECFLKALEFVPPERVGGLVAFMDKEVFPILGRMLRRKYEADLAVA